MRHILCKSKRQHIVLIALEAKVLNPLNLVAATIDESLIEGWEVLPTLHHHVGLDELLFEARHILGDGHPVGRKVALAEREGQKIT